MGKPCKCYAVTCLSDLLEASCLVAVGFLVFPTVKCEQILAVLVFNSFTRVNHYYVIVFQRLSAKNMVHLHKTLHFFGTYRLKIWIIVDEFIDDVDELFSGVSF